MMSIRIAIIGYGKIAQDQHMPAILANPDFEIVATASPHPHPEAPGQAFGTHGALIAGMAGRLDAVAICTPPAARYAIARDALDAGLHVLLEKPPAATLGEIQHLEALAGQSRRTLFTAWHAQHNPAVDAARALLAGKVVTAFHIHWFEDVRKWHPGQEWIWEPGGFGVFDPGINALSIATRILPVPLFVRAATLRFPSNRQTPIAASLTFASERGAFGAELDWRYTEGERWTIRAETADGGVIELHDGGATLLVNGERRAFGGAGEYRSIYERFAALIRTGQSDVDSDPLRIVADAYLAGRRELVEPFA
ncbi:Gfo/Idh/MocA family oxidoreductase [Allosphingosinicella flava]|uniref:Gfo/Idh/MocA family oxidoreductase n=1 Tax=Allosphingosinicella flava TaxID=2771430 RepID=A0A7T2LNL3_9SPHN|nr:Gfo/Idh/MocA family oxidoreductase [Sphingosinicella flava]QPQ56302.1 Gfo/Idh/MocA family oxidoreductase [Sphingosinicella flava]